jgi:hypothetical protein
MSDESIISLCVFVNTIRRFAHKRVAGDSIFAAHSQD